MVQSKLPAFQFYTGDWMKDPLLRCVSHCARGLWIDMLCLMHESDRRGFLQLPNGEPMSEVHIARMTGIPPEEVSRLLTELDSSGVYSRTERGTIYSRRMARDESKRVKCKEAGKLGGNPKLQKNEEFGATLKGHSKGEPKGESNRLPTPSSSSSFSSSKELKDTPSKPPEKPPAVPVPKLPEDHKPQEPKPQRVTTPVQNVVKAFKITMKVDQNDTAWDKVYFRRYARPAKDLLDLFGNDLGWVCDCIESVAMALDKKGLTWTPETIVKHAGDFKNGRLMK